MNRIFFLVLLLLLLPGAASAENGAQVSMEVFHSRDQYPVGGTYPILLQLRIPEGWYIHGPPGTEEGSGLIPTKLSFEAEPGVRVEDIRFAQPRPVSLPFQSDPALLFEGRVRVQAMLFVKQAAAAGPRTLQGVLSYQACSSNACLPPETTGIEIPLIVAPAGETASLRNPELFQASSEKASSGFPFHAGTLLTLIGLFLGGLALNLTPCIYPLIPITVSYFGGRGSPSLGKNLAHGALYLAGLASTNSALGVAAALSGGMLGAVLQNPWVLGGVAAVLLTMALSFFGLWELRPPAALNRLASRRVGGYVGSAFMGLTLGVVAAPCIGPFILGLLAYVGQQGDPLLGFTYFFVLSLGMGLPLALLGVFSGAIDRLPGSGDWMVWVRKLLGWILVGMAVYMILPLLPHRFPQSWLLAGLALAAGAHLGWLEPSGRSSLGFRRIRRGTGILLLAGGLVFLWQSGRQEQGISWTPYRTGILFEAAMEGRPVLLDFSADWCVPCRELDERVFTKPRVVETAGRFATIRVDLTRRKAEHEKVRKRFSVQGVPTVVFLDSQGREILDLRVTSFVEPQVFLNHMQQALEGPAAPVNPSPVRLYEEAEKRGPRKD